MNDYIAEITLDLNCEVTTNSVALSQHDHGKKLRLSVTSHGTPYPLNGCTVVMQGINTDGRRFATACDINNDGTADVTTDDITFSQCGFVSARFVISDSQRSYYTQRLMIYVDSSPQPDITEDPAYSILDRLIRRIHEIDEHGGVLIDEELNAQSNHPLTNSAITAALGSKLEADGQTSNVTYSTDNSKKLYTNAVVDNQNGLIITFNNNYYQLFIGNTNAKIRYRSGEGYSAWYHYVPMGCEKKVNKMADLESVTAALNDPRWDYGQPWSAVTYPSVKAMKEYVDSEKSGLQSQINGKASSSDVLFLDTQVSALYGAVSDVRSYIGYTENDILGLQVDLANNRFTRLAAAEGLTAGEDFDDFPMYGGRKRVVVDSSGDIVFDDPADMADIDEGDTAYDFMVYQPKFYYKVVPLKLEKRENGLGYHIRKANYYISANPHPGFKVHPVFIDKNGNEVDYVLFSAFEASYLWDRQVSSNGVTPTYFDDDSDSSTAIDASAVLKSMPNVKPISGKYKALTKTNAETLAQRKNANCNWHLDTIQSVAANQLLMMIEFASLNMQTAFGSSGIVSAAYSDGVNGSCLTGSTRALGDSTGAAEQTYPSDGGTPYTVSGKLAVSYRGMENPWGNSWKHVNGINLFGDGTMNGGQAYVCSDFGFNESKHDGNYKPTGLFLTNAYGYSSAFAYGGEEYDWMFIPSESGGNSSNPIGDIADVVSNLDGYRIVMFGGPWYSSTSAGEFCTYFKGPVNHKYSNIGCRLLFVPAANV